MVCKSIYILLTIFSFHCKVKLESQEPLFDFTDIMSMKNFLVKHYTTNLSDFLSFKKLTLEEKNATALDLFLKIESLIQKLSAMRSKDEKLDQSLWENYVLKAFKTEPIDNKDIFNVFGLNSRLKTLRKNIRFDVAIFSNRYLSNPEDYSPESICLHARALNHYKINYHSFDRKIDKFLTDTFKVDSIHQLFFDLTFLLSQGEMKTNNTYIYSKRASSLHQGLYNVYRQVIITSFEEFSVQYFSLLGQAICQPEPLQYRSILLTWENNFMNSLQRIMNMTKAALHNISYYLHSHNPVEAEIMVVKEDMNIELERMIQTAIIPEKDLSTTQSCSHNCKLRLIKDTLNKKECDEYLDCYYKSNYYMINHLTNSSRRYSHFYSYDREYPRKKCEMEQFGNENGCLYFGGRISRVSSEYSWGEMRYCDYCICTCVMQKPRSVHSVTALNFRNQVSDIHNNMAVVGLKFVKKDHMIYIQIIEGQVLPHGRIRNESWKPLEKFDYNEETQKFYVVNDNDSKVSLELGKDYGHPEVMNLNDVMAPEKNVITGVRFRIAGDSLDSPKRKKGPIELQIRVTPIDFVKGQLINVNESVWIAPKKKLLKNELILKNPDNPAVYVSSHIEPTITSNKFIKFQASDLEKDAGQSTVPFFDGRRITFYERCLLGGIGLIHRGHPGSGGHLSIKIFDFDMSSYFHTIDNNSNYFLN